MPGFSMISTLYPCFVRHCFSNLSASAFPNLHTISSHIGDLRIRCWYSAVIFSNCSGLGGVPGAMRCSPSSSIHENDGDDVPAAVDVCFCMQHLLYFLPLPHGHSSFLPMSLFIADLDLLWLRIHFCLDGHSHGPIGSLLCFPTAYSLFEDSLRFLADIVSNCLIYIFTSIAISWTISHLPGSSKPCSTAMIAFSVSSQSLRISASLI